MKWTPDPARMEADGFADLPNAIGKAGTTDSVAIISAIWFIARVIAR